METSLHYCLSEKQLCFKLRESVETGLAGIEVEALGQLNTATGSFSYRGTARKFIASGNSTKGSGSTPLSVGAPLIVHGMHGQAPKLSIRSMKYKNLNL